MAVINAESMCVSEAIQSALRDGQCSNTSGMMLFDGFPALAEGDQRPTASAVIRITVLALDLQNPP